MIAQQLGLAMMPRWSRIAAALISGTTSGTSASMRKAEELSTTVAPARTASGAKRREVLPPAENSARSTPAKLSSLSSRTRERRDREIECLTRRARRCKQPQLRQREAPLLQAAHQLDAHGAGGADDRHYRP